MIPIETNRFKKKRKVTPFDDFTIGGNYSIDGFNNSRSKTLLSVKYTE